MFDIGPSELVLIFIVALLVIGPEKLPSTIRTASLWVGRFRRSFHKIKAEVEKELNTDEIRRQLHNESILEEVEKAKSGVDNFTKDLKNITADSDNNNETDLKQDTKTDTAPTDSTVKQDTAAANPPPEPDNAQKETENSIAGELKQAVSYVNDISRDVKSSAKDMEAELSEPVPEAKPKAKKQSTAKKKPKPETKSKPGEVK